MTFLKPDGSAIRKAAEGLLGSDPVVQIEVPERITCMAQELMNDPLSAAIEDADLHPERWEIMNQYPVLDRRDEPDDGLWNAARYGGKDTKWTWHFRPYIFAMLVQRQPVHLQQEFIERHRCLIEISAELYRFVRDLHFDIARQLARMAGVGLGPHLLDLPGELSHVLRVNRYYGIRPDADGIIGRPHVDRPTTLLTYHLGDTIPGLGVEGAESPVLLNGSEIAMFRGAVFPLIFGEHHPGNRHWAMTTAAWREAEMRGCTVFFGKALMPRPGYVPPCKA